MIMDTSLEGTFEQDLEKMEKIQCIAPGPNIDQPISNQSAEPQNLNLDSSSHIEMLERVTTDGGSQMEIAAMDDDLYNVLYEGDTDTLKKYPDAQLQRHRTPKYNTVLHIAAQYGQVDSVRWILVLHLCSSLLLLPNLRGDTPLHLAAREGYIDVVLALFDAAKADSKEMESGIGTDKVMLRMTNKEEDTAFHEAVRYNHPDIVELLIQKDPEFSYGANITGHTPLYMAAEMGYGDLVKKIIDESHTSPTHTGIMGRTALHAAVIRNNKDMVEKILEWNQDLTKYVDHDGWSPLHCAAYLGYTDIVKQLLHGRSDKSVIYLQINNGKKTALHIAATHGHLDIVKELLLTSPACCEQVDDTDKNVFHFAMMKMDDTYPGILLEDDRLSLRGLINEKDSEGNTPLHLLATYQLPDGSFISDSKVDRMAFNKGNLTAIDILSLAKDTGGEKEPALRKFRSAKAINGPLTWKNVTKGDSDTSQNEDPEDKYVAEMKRRSEIHLIVAALIATVTFAAGFTLPGGYTGDEGAGAGLAILIRRASFKVFVVSDTIAMVLSTSAVWVYFFMQLHEKKEALFKHLFRGFLLTMFAMGAMMVAFMTGMYAVLPQNSGLGIVTILLCCCFFIFFYYVFKKLITS